MTSHPRRVTPPLTSPTQAGEIRRTPVHQEAKANFPLWGSSSRGVSLQESEAPEEIAPGDITYRLEPLPKAPPQTQPPGYFSQYCKPQWLPFSKTSGECCKSWRKKPETYPGTKSSHSGDYHMSATHQISFQNPRLGESMFPVHVQGRKVAPIMRPGYVECISQHQSNFQASGWNRVLKTDPNKSSQGIKQAFLSSQMPYLPSPKSLVNRVKGKCPSSTLRALKAKLQTETAGKQFSQVHYGDPHRRGHEKLPGVGSPAPTEDQTATRTSYMPLFSERLNLCKPKVNSIKWEPNTISLLNKGKHSGQSSCLKTSSRSNYDNRTQNSQM